MHQPPNSRAETYAGRGWIFFPPHNPRSAADAPLTTPNRNYGRPTDRQRNTGLMLYVFRYGRGQHIQGGPKNGATDL